MIPADKIKWIIENIKPEGFSCEWSGTRITREKLLIIELKTINYSKPHCWHHTAYEFQDLIYPLFLEKVIEKINHLCADNLLDWYICNELDRHVVGNTSSSRVFEKEYFHTKPCSVDHPKEKAILYIVDKIRGEE